MIRRLITEHRALDLRPEVWGVTLGMALCAGAWPFLPGPWGTATWLLGFALFCLFYGEAQVALIRERLAKHRGDRWEAFLDGWMLEPVLFGPPVRIRTVLLIVVLQLLLYSSCPLRGLLR